MTGWERDELRSARRWAERHDPTYWAEDERPRDEAARDAWLENNKEQR